MRFPVDDIYKDCYLSVYYEQKCAFLHRRKKIMAPGEMEQIILKKKDLERYPGLEKLPVVSVKTSFDIPKERLMECIELLRSVTVTAPVHQGDVLVKAVPGIGAEIVATKTVEAAEVS